MSRAPSANALQIARETLAIWEGQNSVDIADAWVSVGAALIEKMGAVHGTSKALETAIQDLRLAVSLRTAKPPPGMKFT